MNPKVYKIAVALLLFLICAPVFAEEPASEKENAKKTNKEDTQMRPKPDSAISVVLQLPEVKKWKEWISAKHDGSYLDVWGESIKEVEGSKCWAVAVAEKTEEDSKILARFCIMQSGLEIWVENVSHDIPEVVTYFTYENWIKTCKPTEKSPGNC